jgi:hypothetical protein
MTSTTRSPYPGLYECAPTYFPPLPFVVVIIMMIIFHEKIKKKNKRTVLFFFFSSAVASLCAALCVFHLLPSYTHTRAYHHCTAITLKYKKRTHRLRLIVACCSVGSPALLYHYSQSIFLLFSFFYFIFIFLKNILDCRHIRSRDVHFIYLCADFMLVDVLLWSYRKRTRIHRLLRAADVRENVEIFQCLSVSDILL